MHSNPNKNQSHFIEMVEDIRHELTEKIADISSSGEINGENIKLLKEMTTIIKELDKLIKEDRSENRSGSDDELNFLLNLKEKSTLI